MCELNCFTEIFYIFKAHEKNSHFALFFLLSFRQMKDKNNNNNWKEREREGEKELKATLGLSVGIAITIKTIHVSTQLNYNDNIFYHSLNLVLFGFKLFIKFYLSRMRELMQ